MNIKRGLFRLWIVLSTLFVIAVAVVFFGDAKNEFGTAEFEKIFHAIRNIPILCSEARGKKGDDYREFAYLDQTRILCWYEAPKFRVLYPEYKDLNDDRLSDSLYKELGLPITGPDPAPWTFILKLVALALGVPAIVLAVGAALSWSIAGFRSQQPN